MIENLWREEEADGKKKPKCQKKRTSEDCAADIVQSFIQVVIRAKQSKSTQFGLYWIGIIGSKTQLQKYLYFTSWIFTEALIKQSFKVNHFMMKIMSKPSDLSDV